MDCFLRKISLIGSFGSFLSIWAGPRHPVLLSLPLCAGPSLLSALCPRLPAVKPLTAVFSALPLKTWPWMVYVALDSWASVILFSRSVRPMSQGGRQCKLVAAAREIAEMGPVFINLPTSGTLQSVCLWPNVFLSCMLRWNQDRLERSWHMESMLNRERVRESERARRSAEGMSRIVQNSPGNMGACAVILEMKGQTIQRRSACVCRPRRGWLQTHCFGEIFSLFKLIRTLARTVSLARRPRAGFFPRQGFVQMSEASSPGPWPSSL